MNHHTGVDEDVTIAVAAAANKGATILIGRMMAVYVSRVGSALAVNLVTAMFFFGLMMFSPIWGTIADVTGHRRAVVGGR